MMRRVWKIAIVGLLAVAACSGSEGDTTTSAGPTASSSTAVTTTEASPASTIAATTTTSPPTTTKAPQAPESLTTLAAALGDVAAIEVTVTGTHRPRFDWSSAVTAARYMTVVMDDAGTVLWSWEGEGETVTVGSGEIDRDGPGGRLVRPGWLLVIGFGDEGSTVAVSDAVPVGG